MYEKKHGLIHGTALRPRKETATNFLDRFADELVGAKYDDDWQALIDRYSAAGHSDLERYRGDYWRRGEIAAEVLDALRTIDRSPHVLETGMTNESGVFGAARKAAVAAEYSVRGVGAGRWTVPDLRVDTPLNLAAARPRQGSGPTDKPTEQERIKAYQEDLDAFGGFGQPVPSAVPPTVNDGAHRIAYILADQPAQFDIEVDAERDGNEPIHSIHSHGMAAIQKYNDIIEKESFNAGVDPDLVRAIMYVENAQGGLRDRLGSYIREPTSILPMNINPEIWRGLASPGADFKDPVTNIRSGVALIKRITDRIANPTAEKVGSIWNFTGSESGTNVGARIGQVYESKPWLGRETTNPHGPYVP